MTLFTGINLIALLSLNIIGGMIVFWIYSANKNKKDVANLLFLLVVICMVMWTNFNYLGDVVNQASLSLTSKKIYFALVSIFFIFIYFFSVYFPIVSEKRNTVFEKFTIFIWALNSLLILFTNTIIKGVEREYWGVNIINGGGIYFFYPIVTFYVFLVLYIVNHANFARKYGVAAFNNSGKYKLTDYKLTKKYLTLSDDNKRKVLYFLVGITIYAIFQLAFNVFVPIILKTKQYWQFGDYSAIFFLLLTAYAIIKHELLGIKTILTQVWVVVISSILLVDMIFLSSAIAIQLLKLTVLITFLYFSWELIKSIKKEKEARKELEKAYDKIKQYTLELEKVNKNLTEKNEDLDALLSLNQTSSSGSEIKKGIQNILNILPTKFGYTKIIGAALLRCDEKSNSAYAYITTESILLKKGVSLLPKPALTDYALVVSEENHHNLTIEAILSNKIQKSEKLTDFASPPVEKHIAQLMQKAMGIKSVVTIPLNVRGVKLGALMLMFSKPLKEITQRDMDLITAFSQQVGVMIENLNYYETLNKNIEELTRTKNNLEEILTMKNDFLHIVSHQLRTPLTAVRGLISMWYDGDFDHFTADKMKGIKDRVLANADRLNNIINLLINNHLPLIYMFHYRTLAQGDPQIL